MRFEFKVMAKSVALQMAYISAVKMLESFGSFHEERMLRAGQKRAQPDEASDGSTEPSVKMEIKSEGEERRIERKRSLAFS